MEKDNERTYKEYQRRLRETLKLMNDPEATPRSKRDLMRVVKDLRIICKDHTGRSLKLD